MDTSTKSEFNIRYIIGAGGNPVRRFCGIGGNEIDYSGLPRTTIIYLADIFFPFERIHPKFNRTSAIDRFCLPSGGNVE